MTCGVYAILCLANDKFYIGSSANIESRIRDHFNELRRGANKSQALQEAYDEYGLKHFTITILDECSKSQRFRRESEWIDLFGPSFLLNVTDRPKVGGGTAESARKAVETRNERYDWGSRVKKAWETRRKRYGSSGGNIGGSTSEIAKKAWKTRRKRYGKTGVKAS